MKNNKETKEVILTIDTSSNQKICVGLIINGEENLIEQNITPQKSQVVLPLIDQLLEKHSLKLSDISGIKVNIGPGSFTGVRVGVTIANTLGFSLNIPINGKEKGVLVEPIYE